MIRLALIADDLTGAADSGVQFAKRGWSTLLLVDCGPAEDAEVVILDTESRADPPEIARAKVHAAASSLPALELIYKKMDSTLRGNVGAELEAIMEARGLERAVVAPAFPASGRTTVAGRQLLDGRPLDRTRFARDPLSPVIESYIPALLGRQMQREVGLIELPVVQEGVESLAHAMRARGEAVLVVDAMTGHDLQVIARAAAQAGLAHLTCGSAGLADAVAEAILGRHGVSAVPGTVGVAVADAPVLIVAGSPNPVTALQLSYAAEKTGVAVLRVDTEGLAADADTEIGRVVAQAGESLGKGQSAALSVVSSPYVAGLSRTLAGALGEMAARLAEEHRLAGLVLTGGDVALAVCRSLGTTALLLLREVAPGVPLGRICGGPWAGLNLVTKAGGFGDRGAILAAVQELRRPRRSLNGPRTLGEGPRKVTPECILARGSEVGWWNTVPDKMPLSDDGRAFEERRSIMSSNYLPILGITIGDVCGSGPEIVTKALARLEVQAPCRSLVIGDAAVLRQAYRITGEPGGVRAVGSLAEAAFEPGVVDVLDLKNINLSQLTYGQVNPMAGKAAYDYVARAIQLALAGEIDALVTSALNKEALNLAGYHYAGHTEILRDLCGAKNVTMMLVSGSLRVTHVSTHVALREAIEYVKRDRIVGVAELTRGALLDLGIEKPRLAVAALNPHSGEGGLFGDEEAREIGPAVADLRDQGWDVTGPVPADSVYWRALQSQFDAVVAMYHDQGHIPIKVLGLLEGVNVTLGLPIIRTSVDHGTNFGKAGKGTADATSLVEAVKLAARLVAGRRERTGKSTNSP